MSELPPGWIILELGDIAETRLGKMLSRKSMTGSRPRPYLRNRNVQWGRFDLDDLAEMDFTEDEAKRFELIAGDLVVCEGGEVGRAAIWRNQRAEVYYQKALHRIRGIGATLPEYLFYLLRHYGYTKAFERFVTGSTIAHLPQEDLRRLPVPLPPLAEQKRIVAAIEEHFSRLDDADASLRSAGRRIRRIRRAVLKSAVSGTWPVRLLADVAEVRLGRQRSPKNHVGDSMRPYLRAANVTWAGVKLHDVKRMNFTAEEFETYRLRPGDVLVAEASGSKSEVGKPALWRGASTECCFQNTLLRVRSSGPLPEWLHLVIHEAAVSGRLGEAASGVGIHHLGASRLARWPVPLPAIEEQRRVVADTERKLSILDSLTTAIDQARTRCEHLRRAILERAFTGRLVPQDPSDEPASVLLERIRAEGSTKGTPEQRMPVGTVTQ